MSLIARGRGTPLGTRALRARNACVHDLAQRTGLPAPAPEHLDGVDSSAGLMQTWDWWCAACVREPVVGWSDTSSAQKRRTHVLLRATLVGTLVLLALAMTPSPLGS